MFAVPDPRNGCLHDECNTGKGREERKGGKYRVGKDGDMMERVFIYMWFSLSYLIKYIIKTLIEIFKIE